VYAERFNNYSSFYAAKKLILKNISMRLLHVNIMQINKKDVNVIPLKEEDAYPAKPEDGYGWE
jgi:hypothetical protein